MLRLLTPALSQTDGVLSADGRKVSRPAPITLGKLQSAPKIDGILSDGEWDGATKTEINSQIEPGDNTPATERTEVYLACDREHLYLAFHAFDSEPGAVRAPVSRRDDIGNDDNVEVMLDTYDEWRPAEKSALNKWLVYIWPYVLGAHSRTADGRPELQFIDPAIEFKLQRGIQLNYYYSFRNEGFAGRTFPHQFQSFYASAERFKRLTFSSRAQWGEAINFDPQQAVVGASLEMEHDLSAHPHNNLSVEWLYLKSRLNHRQTGVWPRGSCAFLLADILLAAGVSAASASMACATSCTSGRCCH